MANITVFLHGIPLLSGSVTGNVETIGRRRNFRIVLTAARNFWPISGFNFAWARKYDYLTIYGLAMALRKSARGARRGEVISANFCRRNSNFSALAALD
jgi:hypothetical protein